LWKTFVSPSSPYRLFVNDATAEFQVVGLREDPPPAPWVQVPPCSAARHRAIAEEFVSTLPHGHAKMTLERLLSERIWWMPFFDAARQLGLEKRWLDLRRAALFDEFEKTLASVGLSRSRLSELKPHGAPSPGPGLASRPFDESRDPADAARSSRRPIPSEPLNTPTRRAALAIVSRLSESELRELRFRLGDILDVLSAR
jgi:hypothetical protein